MTTLATAPQAPKYTVRDRATVLGVKGLANTFLVGALAVSYTHIVTVFDMLGLQDGQQYIVPAALDGIMMLGRFGMGTRFAASTRKAGRRIFLSMLGLSLVCNVAAGLHSIGGMLWGVLVIAGLVIVEWFSPQVLPAPLPELSPQQRAAITRKANAEAAAQAKAAQAAKRRKAKAPAVRAAKEVRGTNIDAELAKLLPPA